MSVVEPRRPGRGRGVRLLDHAERWLPFALAALFLAVLAVDLRDVLTAVYRNGDAASGPVIAELLGRRHGGDVVLGEYFWFEALGLLRALVWLPGHRQLEQVLPLVLYAVTVAGVAWSLAAAVGRRRAGLVAAILACPAPVVLDALAALNFHGLALVHTAILAVGLTALVRGGERWSRRRLIAGASALAVLTAPGVASDQLAIVGGLLPFAGATGALAALRLLPRRSAWAAAGTTLGALAGAALLHAGAVALDLHVASKPFATATAAQLSAHAQLFLDCFGVFGHGETGQVLDAWTGLLYAAAVGTFGLLVVAAIALRRGLPRLRALPPLTAALTLFWGGSAAALFVAFIATSAVVDVTAYRYILGAWPAVLALLALLLPEPSGRRVLATATVVVAALGIAQLARGDYDETSGFVDGTVAGQLERLVRAEHADHGYSGYWTAADVTFATRFATRTYPIVPCGADLCAYKLHRLDAWYVPRPRVRTFYVVDTLAPEPRVPDPPAAWGAARMVLLGPLRVFLYDYDIARNLKPSPPTNP